MSDSDCGLSLDTNERSIIVKGQIKWFDANKGFGFIKSPNFDADILLHFSCLRQAGLSSAHEGAQVECEVVKRKSGLQAQRLIYLENAPVFPGAGAQSVGSAGQRTAGAQSRKRPAVALQGPLIDAVAKWFSRPKGFGFVIASAGEDVFVHMELLRQCGIRELKPGQKVRVRTAMGEKGLQATFIEMLPEASQRSGQREASI